MMPNKNKGFVLLISGLSGSGKSILANLLKDYLKKEKDNDIFILDGDVTRAFFDGNLAYGEEARLESGRRLMFGAHLLSETGTNVVVTCIMGNSETRKVMKDKVNFIEIFMDANIEDCIKSDPKGVYKKNISLEKPNLRGIDMPFEKPEDAALVLNPYKEKPEESLRKLVNFLEEKGLI